MIKDERLRLLSALGHVVEVLDDLKPCGHSGDEETGEHDADCMLCRWEAAMAHAEEEGESRGGVEPSSPLPLADVPPSPCGKPCDHGSPCILSAGHVPADRHETEHGCVFFDPRGSVRGTDAVCMPPVSAEGMTCPDCDGRGHELVYTENKCGFCGGTGHVLRDHK